ncbi:MAG: hypothetical protein U7123_24990 [Potamolinea sp.]
MGVNSTFLYQAAKNCHSLSPSPFEELAVRSTFIWCPVKKLWELYAISLIADSEAIYMGARIPIIILSYRKFEELASPRYQKRINKQLLGISTLKNQGKRSAQ